MNSELALPGTVFSPLCIRLQCLWPLLMAVFKFNNISTQITFWKIFAMQFVFKEFWGKKKKGSKGASFMLFIHIVYFLAPHDSSCMKRTIWVTFHIQTPFKSVSKYELHLLTDVNIVQVIHLKWIIGGVTEFIQHLKYGAAPSALTDNSTICNIAQEKKRQPFA